MKKKKRIILVLSLLLCLSVGVLFYLMFMYEPIELKRSEVTISYIEKANRNSSYYFKGIKEEFKFDESLFDFKGVGDYKVKLKVKDQTYTVIFHVVDDVKPEIQFLNQTIDLNSDVTLTSLYSVTDVSEVEIKCNLSEEELTVGDHFLEVSAKDQYGNENSASTTLHVVDTTPKLNIYANVSLEYDFANMSLDAIIQDYMAKKGVENEIAISYHNFVSGEEYFFNGDQYMVAASTYKLPLNMHYYELRNAGAVKGSDELEFRDYSFEAGGPVGDTLYEIGDKISIDILQYYSILYSDNTASRILFDGLGGWTNYRNAIRKFSSVSYENEFYENKFKVRYMNDVLQYLYQHASSFEELLYRLQVIGAKSDMQRLIPAPVAMKDGNYGLARNAAGIIYADKPYAAAIYCAVGEYGNTMISEINYLLYRYAMAH